MITLKKKVVPKSNPKVFVLLRHTLESDELKILADEVEIDYYIRTK